MKHGRLIRWVGLLLMGGLLWAVCAMALGQERREAEDWLRRAHVAPRTVAYHGLQRTSFSWGQRRVVSEVAISHEPPDRTRRDYQGQELAGLTVISADHHTWRYDPRLGRTDEVAGAGDEVPLDVRGYRLRVGPGETVAGRATRRVSVVGRGGERTFWIDIQTGLLLGNRTRQPTGQTAETVFVRLDLGPSAEPVDYSPPAGAMRRATEPMKPADLAARLGFALLMPRWTPAGHQLVGTYLFHCPCCDMVSAQLTYSDGMTTFSLFEGARENAGCMASGECCSTAGSQGACVGATRDDSVVVGRLDRAPVVLAVGDLPPATLRRVVEALY